MRRIRLETRLIPILLGCAPAISVSYLFSGMLHVKRPKQA